MSQIEPYDYSQMPPDYGDEFDEPMQMRGGSSWQPGWRPPSQHPGCGPPWPGPGPGGGGWPFWGYWGFRLRSAWRDVKFLNKLIGDIINEQIDNGIIAPGPNYVPPPGQTPAPTPGIKGVTDGSDASTGQVGEFMTGSTVISYAAYPADTTTSASPLVVPPGDWDLWAYISTTAQVGAIKFLLSPHPTGISNTMTGGLWLSNVTVKSAGVMPGLALARGSFSVPTLLAFSVEVYQGDVATLPAGQATLTVEARRRR